MEKILVIDDDAATRRLLKETLNSSGYEVAEAANGEDGFQKAQAEKPDLIIADILMPVRDGYQLAKDLRNNPATASMPIMMLTGLAEEYDELKAFQEGVDDYVIKPVRPRVLQARVAALLARSRAMSEPEEDVIPSQEIKDKTSSGCRQLDKAIGGGFPRGANILITGETGSGKSSFCRRFLATQLKSSERAMMITLDDEPRLIRDSLGSLLKKPLSNYEKGSNFRLVDGYSWTRGGSTSKERFAVSGVLELNQLAGAIADAGQELGQSLSSKAGGCRVFDSISSLFINFELAAVQRFIAQVARTASSYGGVTTMFVVEEGAVAEQTLNNIKYIMDGLLEMKVDGEGYYLRVSNMKWSRFSRDWIEVSE
jgi:two-component system, OmpR family, alkaline phosphatase synthesis response regulator PhoP